MPNARPTFLTGAWARSQVISDYLTPLDDAYLQTMNRPIAQWTYKLAFVRTPAAAPERSP